MKYLIKSVLKLGDLSVPQRIEKAKFIIMSMTGNANFPTPAPTLADVQTATDDLEKSYLSSRAGNRDVASLMREKDRTLRNLLNNLNQYVEFVANQAVDGGESIILSAGMEPKAVTLSRDTSFRVENTDLSGQVVLRTKAESRASFIWESTENGPVMQWKEVSKSVQATVYVKGLTRGKEYLFRVATINKDGQGDWSDPVSLLVA